MIFKEEAGIKITFGDKSTPLPSEAKRVIQVHGKNCMIVEDPNQQTDHIEADALVTALPGVTLAIKTADCLPILLYDSKEKIIAAVHAGWRGAKAGIIEESLEVMRSLGAKEIKASLGPSIKLDSYQVGEEFRDFFPDKYFIKKLEKFYFDLPKFAQDSLEKAGVREIWTSDLDTYSNKNLYSYRRSNGKLLTHERNLSFIYMSTFVN
jgi:YfiH family protein